MSKNFLIFLIISFLFLLPTNVFAFDMDTSVSPTSKLSTNCGGQEAVTVSLTNKGNYYGTLCWWSLDKSSWTKGTNSCLSPEGGAGTFLVNLDVPTSGSITHNVYVACRNYGHWDWSLLKYVNDCVNTNTWSTDYKEGYTKTTDCLINSQQDADCVYQQSVTLECNVLKQQAEAEITKAENLISDAQSLINTAQSKITEASDIGADITQANSHLLSANTGLTNAQTYLNTARTSYNADNYESAKTNAQQAQTSANNAKNNANQAKSSAEQATQQVSQEKIDASNTISIAKSAIDDSKKRIEDAEKLINNVTVIGMDTTSAEGDVATARSKLETAEDYYSEASSNFNSKNYDLAKQKADSAESYSSQAESLASSAYNSLWTTYSKKRVGAQAILDASGSVSQMNEIMTKMDYVLRNLRDYNIDLTTTQSVTDGAKTSVDSSEDLLSQAKNRMDTGYSDQSADLAVQAKSSADSAKNRLDTIVTKLKFSILDGLKAAYNEKEGKVSTARSEVKSAEGTYGTDSEIVIAAQNKLSEAESELKTASSKIKETENSQSLSDLLKNAEAGFSALENVGKVSQEAIDKANEAKMNLIKTAGSIVAIGAAAGGGFLYWRRKKKGKKVKPKEEKKTKEAKKEKPKKKKFCPKCGSKIKKGSKFCHKCGKKMG